MDEESLLKAIGKLPAIQRKKVVFKLMKMLTNSEKLELAVEAIESVEI